MRQSSLVNEKRIKMKTVNHFVKKAFVSKSVGPDWPRYAAVIPNETRTVWFKTKQEAQDAIDAYNQAMNLPVA